MKAVTAKTVKTEIANVDTANLPKPKKMAVKTVASKVQTGIASQETTKPVSPEAAKIAKIAAEKVSSKKVTTKAAESTPNKVSAKRAIKPKEIQKTEPIKLLVNKQARPSREEIERMIAQSAYFRAEKRCFEVGYEKEDWLMAEQEINQLYSPDT